MGAGRVGQSWKGGSGGLVGEHRAGREAWGWQEPQGLAGAMWYLRDLPVAGDLPPLSTPSTACEGPGPAEREHQGVLGVGCHPGGAAPGSAEQGGLSPPPTARPRWELQDRFCRVSPGPLPGPRRGPSAGAARPPTARGPPRPPPFHREPAGDTTASPPPAGNPSGRVGFRSPAWNGAALPCLPCLWRGCRGHSGPPPRPQKIPDHG